MNIMAEYIKILERIIFSKYEKQIIRELNRTLMKQQKITDYFTMEINHSSAPTQDQDTNHKKSEDSKLQ